MGDNEVVRVEPSGMGSGPLEKIQRVPSSLPPCEDTARRWPSMNEGAGPHQTLNPWMP